MGRLCLGNALPYIQAMQATQDEERCVCGRPVAKVAADGAQPGVLCRPGLQQHPVTSRLQIFCQARPTNQYNWVHTCILLKHSRSSNGLA